MRNKLIIGGGIAGVLSLVLVVLDPLGFFDAEKDPNLDIPVPTEGAEDVQEPDEEDDVQMRRVVALDSQGQDARDVEFFVLNHKGTEIKEAKRGWDRIPVHEEVDGLIAAKSGPLWSESAPFSMDSQWETELTLAFAAASFSLSVELEDYTPPEETVEGEVPAALPALARLSPLGDSGLVGSAQLYLTHLGEGDPWFPYTNQGLHWPELPPCSYQLEVVHGGSVTHREVLDLQPGANESRHVLLRMASSLRGQIEAEDGKVIRDARVALIPPLQPDALEDPLYSFRLFGEWPETTLTREKANRNGIFSFDAIDAGEWIMLVYAEGYLPWVSSTTILSKAGVEITSDPVVLVPGGSLHLDVKSPDGEAMEDAEVRWMQPTPSGTPLPSHPHSKATLSDSKGRVTLVGLPAGTIRIQVLHGSYGSRVYTLDVDPEAETQRLEAQLPEALPLRGVVVDRLKKEPVGGAQLTLLPRNDLEARSGFPKSFQNQTICDAEGQFEFSTLPAGTYTLLAEHTDFAPTLSPPLSVTVDLEGPIQVEISPGGSLMVEVLDKDGKPLEKQWVVVVSESNQRAVRGQTDGRGLAYFDNMPADTYRIMRADSVTQAMSRHGRLHRDYEFASLMDLERRSVLLGGRELNAAVEGFVLHRGKPAPGRRVALLADDGTHLATTDPSGFYHIEDLIPGNYLFQVTDGPTSSNGIFCGSVYVGATALQERDIVLPAASLTVRVMAEGSGHPLAQVPMNLRPASGDEFSGGQFQSSDENGTAVFRTLRPGTHILTVGDAAMPFFGGDGRYGARILTVEVPTQLPSDRQLDVRLPGSAQVSAVVRDATGAGVLDAHLHYEDTHGQVLNPLSMMGTNQEGRGNLRGLPPGAGYLVARHPEIGIARMPLQLVEGQRLTCSLELEPAARLMVQVSDSEGRPLTGVTADLLDRDGRLIRGHRSLEEAQSRRLAILRGTRQELGPLPPGSYFVQLSRPGQEAVRHEVVVNSHREVLDLRLTY